MRAASDRSSAAPYTARAVIRQNSVAPARPRLPHLTQTAIEGARLRPLTLIGAGCRLPVDLQPRTGALDIRAVIPVVASQEPARDGRLTGS